ncbi:MAG TPA: hypothetical protein VM120_01850 [Bryobacteraceae bacterium]|nr:hypothetical protein [Bryobacteraceae bacterium]
MPVLLLLIARTVFAGDWEALQRIAPDRMVEITTRDGTQIRGAFVSAAGNAMLVRQNSGERSIPGDEIRKVRVTDPSRRLRTGLISIAVGAGVGLAIGFAICPHCANEGNGYKFAGPGVAIGAAIGALGFLSTPYRTVYKRK